MYWTQIKLRRAHKFLLFFNIYRVGPNRLYVSIVLDNASNSLIKGPYWICGNPIPNEDKVVLFSTFLIFLWKSFGNFFVSLLQTIWKPIHVLFNLSISFFFSVLQLCYLYLKWYRSLRKNNAKFTYFFMFTFVWKYKKY